MNGLLRDTISLFTIALICATVHAQDDAPAPPQTAAEEETAAPSKGVPTQSKEGNFTVTLPTVATPLTQEIPSDLGPIKLHSFSSEQSDTTYMVFYSDYPKEVLEDSTPQAILDSAIGGAIESFDAPKVVLEQKLKLDDHPGKQVLFYGQSGEERVSAAWRVFLVKNRLYQIGIISNGKPIDGNKLDMTFDSFKLNGN